MGSGVVVYNGGDWQIACTEERIVPTNNPIGQGLQPLTPKAIKFCELVAKGHRPSEAYIEAYRVQGTAKKRSIQAAAARLTGDARVQRQVAKLKEKDATAAFQQAIGLRQWTLDRLKEEASDKKSPPAARVSALGVLARASRLIDGNNQQNVSVNVATVSRSLADIESELLERLSRVSGASVEPSVCQENIEEGEILGEDEPQDDEEIEGEKKPREP